jgi:dihydrofolate synthase/folylpolyglutamate synthase
MQYSQSIEYLDRHIGHGMKPGLERIATLLEMMGHPEDGYPIVQVAGTNGKTSVSRICTMILTAHGLNTGTFTSPHLERIEERIGVNGRSATPDEFAQAVTDVASFADIFESRRRDSLTYFELTAAIAFAWFAEIAVDTAVVEVGMGGRLDATNVARGEVAVITGIDFDHTETLGNSLAAIAAEKLGIVKPGSILVTGQLPTDALEVAVRVATDLDVQHLQYGRDYRLEGASTAVGGWHCGVAGTRADYEDVFLPLHGRHQTRNLAVAIAAAESLLGNALDEEAVRLGASAVTAPGRLEPVASSPLVVLDGAHNPQGFRVLNDALAEEFGNVSWVLLLAAMHDKNLADMLPALTGRIRAAVATEVGSPRSFKTPALAAAMEELLRIPVDQAADPIDALGIARDLAGREGAILVTGSLYLVGAIRSAINETGPVHRSER